jgi:hypothetical protein
MKGVHHSKLISFCFQSASESSSSKRGKNSTLPDPTYAPTFLPTPLPGGWSDALKAYH